MTSLFFLFFFFLGLQKKSSSVKHSAMPAMASSGAFIDEGEENDESEVSVGNLALYLCEDMEAGGGGGCFSHHRVLTVS